MTGPADNPAGEAPRRTPKGWSHFGHLLARFYMNYLRLLDSSARRRTGRAFDVDTQDDAQGVAWALHWATLGQNKLHDPRRKHGRTTRIDALSTVEVARMRGPNGEHPYTIVRLLRRAWRKRVRVEIETKSLVSLATARSVCQSRYGRLLLAHGLLQVKTLAAMGGDAAIDRLRPWHRAGAPTILSFTDYRGPGITASVAWPVTDYTRGTPRWR